MVADIYPEGRAQPRHRAVHTQRFFVHEHMESLFFSFSRPRINSVFAKIYQKSMTKPYILEGVFNTLTKFFLCLGSILRPWVQWWWLGAAQGIPKLSQEEKTGFLDFPSLRRHTVHFRKHFHQESRKDDSREFFGGPGVHHWRSKANSWKNATWHLQNVTPT